MVNMISAEALDTQAAQAESLDNGLDLEFASTDALDAMGAFNLEQLDKEPASAGDPPGKPKPRTMQDLKRDYDKDLQNWKQITRYGIPMAADQTRNKFQAARVVEFDARKFNVDRYLGYGKSTFDKVGFSPFVDNEKNFNQNTTIWQDYGRMMSVFGPLVYQGAVSSYRSLADTFGSDRPVFSSDDETASEYARLNNIGMSTKGGPLGFANNLTLSMAYTVGTALSVVAEEALLFGLTVATEGAFGGAAAARTAFNIGRLGNAIKRGFQTEHVANILKGSTQLVKSLSKVGDAKDFYTAVRTGGTTFAKGTFQYLNPFSRTADDIYDLYRGSASVRNMSNLAKAKQTFGSFYRDVRDNNFALSESKLEGGSAKIDAIQRLTDEYEKKNGKAPEGDDLARIYDQAEDIGRGVTAVNFPVIFLTNRVVLDGLFKFRGFKTLEQAGELSTKGIGFKKGVGFYDNLADGWLKSSVNTLKNPKAYIGKGVNYFRRNLMEGVQENLQNVTSEAVANYYDGVYKDATLGGFDYAAGHAWDAIKKEMSSGQGLETFASGFLMGGLMGKAQNLFLKDVPQVYYWTKDKIAGTNKLQEYKLNKQRTRQDAINGLNELYKNPLKYFSSRNESAVVQKHTSDVMNLAEENGDAKTFQDAKDLKTFDNIFTALDNGTYDTLLEQFKELKKLSNDELANFLGVDKADPKMMNKLDEVVTRAAQIKERYDVVNDRFKNPFSPKNFKFGTEEFTKEAIAFRAFEAAKKSAVISQYGFDRALERMNGLYQDLSSNRPIRKASGSDITVLTDLNTLDNEINLLDKEVKSYAGVTDKDQKKLAEQKKEKLDLLMDYRDKLRTYRERMGENERDENGQIIISFNDAAEPLKNSYKAYLRYLGKVADDYMFDDKIDESFNKVLDYYSLDSDAKNYSKVVNNLMDPLNLYRHSQMIAANFTKLFQNREIDAEERIARSQRLVELNQLLLAFTANGIMLDPQELQEFVRTGKKPTTFIDPNTLQNIPESSPKYAIAQGLLERDDEIKDPPKPEAAPTAEEPVAPTTTTTAPTSAESAPAATTTAAPTELNLEAELQVKLEDAYNQYVEETGSEISFEEFVKTTRRARNIIKDFRRGKPAEAAPAPATTAATVTPTTPYGTPTGEPITTATEAAKADIERRRQEELNNILGDVIKLEEADTKQKATQAIADATREVGNKALDKAGIIIGEVQWGKNIIDVAKRLAFKIREIQKPAVDRINAKYDAELAALEGAKPAEAAAPVAEEAPLDLTPGLIKVFTEEKDKKIGELLPVYGQALASKDRTEDESAVLADPVKWLEEQIENAEENLQRDEERLKTLTEDAKPEVGEVFVTGTTLGLTNIYGTAPKNFIDKRSTPQRAALERNKSKVFDEEEAGGKKVFSIVDWSVVDNVGRPGYVATSIAFDKDSTITLDDVKADLEAAHAQTMSGVDQFGKISEVKIQQALKGASVKISKNEKADQVKTRMESAKVRIQKSKANLKKVKAVMDEFNDNISRITGKPVEQTQPVERTEPVTEAAPVVVSTEKTGTQKAQELVDSITSLKDVPDLSKADSKPVTIDLIELISTGQAKAKDVVAMIAAKRKELLQNISTKDLQKGDMVTFVDGRKGFVKSINKKTVTFKMVGSEKGATELIDQSKLPGLITSLESGKALSMEPTPEIEITPQEETEVKASQDALASFTENSAAVKEAGEKAAKAAGTDNQENLNNLFKNIGCKTGK